MILGYTFLSILAVIVLAVIIIIVKSIKQRKHEVSATLPDLAKVDEMEKAKRNAQNKDNGFAIEGDERKANSEVLSTTDDEEIDHNLYIEKENQDKTQSVLDEAVNAIQPKKNKITVNKSVDLPNLNSKES